MSCIENIRNVNREGTLVKAHRCCTKVRSAKFVETIKPWLQCKAGSKCWIRVFRVEIAERIGLFWFRVWSLRDHVWCGAYRWWSTTVRLSY